MICLCVYIDYLYQGKTNYLLLQTIPNMKTNIITISIDDQIVYKLISPFLILNSVIF